MVDPAVTVPVGHQARRWRLPVLRQVRRLQAAGPEQTAGPGGNMPL